MPVIGAIYGFQYGKYDENTKKIIFDFSKGGGRSTECIITIDNPGFENGASEALSQIIQGNWISSHNRILFTAATWEHIILNKAESYIQFAGGQSQPVKDHEVAGDLSSVQVTPGAYDPNLDRIPYTTAVIVHLVYDIPELQAHRVSIMPIIEPVISTSTEDNSQAQQTTISSSSSQGNGLWILGGLALAAAFLFRRKRR